MEYRVTWEIDVEAETPAEAATKAHAMQRDPASWATVYDVRDPDGQCERVDLHEIPGGVPPLVVHAFVPLEDGFVRNVKVYASEELAEQAKESWYQAFGLYREEDRERAADWGTSIHLCECEVLT